MEENECINLDLEYNRYLQILRPYIAQLIDDNIIATCNAWINRLSQCGEEDKMLRNKYIFIMCVQLAKGTLEEPFTKYPPGGQLRHISESVVSDESSTEVECYVVNAEVPHTEVLFSSKPELFTDTEYNLSQTDKHSKTGSQGYDSDTKSSQTNKKRSRRHDFMCYACPEILRDYLNYNVGDVYEIRANNLITKLREIKTENMLLHSELLALKEESAAQHNNYAGECATKIDCATSAILENNDSSTNLNSLKFKLQELQDSKTNYLEKISALQEVINNFNDMKKHEIENIEAKHKLEIINVKETINHEVRMNYEKKIEELKQEYEFKIDSIRNKTSSEIEILSTSKNDLIEEKNKIIMAKDSEITKLNSQIEDLKSHLHSVLEKFIDKPTCNHTQEENLKYKAEHLEKRLNRVEKNKTKCAKIYEAKVAQLQRDKHLAECSLQLQMVRQRTQVVNEVTDENQTELTTALDKLETKYKEIVANVQATAIQRRMQDQIALESILHAACGIQNENNKSTGTNGQFSKTMRNQNPTFDSGMSPLPRGNKVGNICIGNKSFTEDSVVTGYCLNGERMGELFERVYVPQRDNPESIK